MSDYLWDKSGEPEADVERLEGLLGRLRHAGAAPEVPFEVGARVTSIELDSRASTRAGIFGSTFFSRPARLAAAAALLLATLAGAFVMLRAFKTDGDRASVNNETQSAPQPSATKEAAPREEIHAPQVASSPSKESATPEPLQREPSRRAALASVKTSPKPRTRELAARETFPSGVNLPVVGRAPARGGQSYDPTASSRAVVSARAYDVVDVADRVRAKEKLVYALRLTSEAMKQVRGKASGVDVHANAFDGRSPLR